MGIDWFLKLSNDNAELRAELARTDELLQETLILLSRCYNAGPTLWTNELYQALYDFYVKHSALATPEVVKVMERK